MPLFEKIRGYMGTFCNQKYSSNVIEQCFINSNEKELRAFILELSHSDTLAGMDPSFISILCLGHMKSQFGNYVV